MKKINQATSALALAALTATAVAPAAAQGIVTAATNWQNQADAGGTLIGIAAFFVGMVIAFVGIMKLRAAVNNPNDPNSKVTTGIFLIAIAAACVTLPEVMGIGVGTLFGETSNTTSLSSGFNSLP